ncbi:STAS domain-containing protein [Alteromonas oceanisediminis]|uniref:STAS domain-containing protein n=1 Tax=Alteromonas oceanisediminis TaxID=2836180 RepID=UPI001BDAD272|nr:STAS domain-containing protein [Alteromonas oceanisediminis]MBT0585433.1 STAS domain-containing protein [Alteromonas oceanisediminis]
MDSRYSVEAADSQTVMIRGDLTMYTLRKDWWEAHAGDVLPSLDKEQTITVDLTDLKRSDSAGLAWLINLVRDTKANGVSIVFSHIPNELVNLAKISDASALLPLK